MPEDRPSSAEKSQPVSLRDVALAGLLLFSLLVFYYPAINGGLVFDDDRLITPAGLRSLHGLWRIWFELGASFQYYPVLHSMMWLECKLWGDAVWGYHLMNIFQHAVAAWLVAAIMRRLSLPAAWLAAFVFALHPVCVETVAWISEQKNTLSAVFYLASLLAYLHFDRDRRMRWYFGALGLFIMALMSKTITAPLPGSLLVILWWQRGRLGWKRDVLPLLPWFALGAAVGLFSGWVERTYYGSQSADFALTLPERGMLACRELWFYAFKLVWPAPLMFNYPHWQVSAAVLWQWLFPLGVLVVVAALCLLARWKRGPLAAFLIFAGNLFPMLGLFYIEWFVFSYVSDHFQYLACLGIIVPLISGLVFAARKIDRAGWRWGARATAGLLLVALGTLTWRQSQTYSDMETFYEKTLAANPESGMAHFNYGLVLVKTPDRLTEAMAQFEEGLRLRPNDGKLRDMAGFIFMTTPGRLPEAIDTLQDALEINPDDAQAHYLLGTSLCVTPGRLMEAVAQLEIAVKLKPGFADAQYMLGNALGAIPGRKEEAIAHLEVALRLNPELTQAKVRLEQLQQSETEY
jgi:tetratricopeptide (TPR) repeat protein